MKSTRVALYVAPTLLIFFFLSGYPILYMLVASFNQIDLYSFSWKFVGLNNYYSLLVKREFYITLENTLIWTLITTAGAFSLGLFCALLLNKEGIKFKNLFGALLFLPFAIGYVEAAFAWLWFTNPTLGIFNYILKSLGLIENVKISLLSTRWSALGVVMLAQIWKHFPFMTMMIRAALQTVRKELYEAAEVDGAGLIGKFINVTVPQIKSTLVLSTLLMLIWNFNSFTLVWVMTQGGPFGQTHIFSTAIYEKAFISFDLGSAAGLSSIVFIVVFTIAILYLKILKYG